MDTNGFYKNDNDTLLYAPNFVDNKDYKLEKNQKDTYQYPVYGWYWFESEDEARSFFNLPLVDGDKYSNGSVDFT